MLQINLLLRFCVLLAFSAWLAACSSVPTKKAGGSEGVVVRNCPANLLGLTQKQVMGTFLSCDPSKDGAPFEDEAKSSLPPEQQDIWLLVDTQKLQLEVKRGNQTLIVFSNIAIGRSGAGFKNRRGDDITPLGEYKIGWINRQSPFHIFYGLNYPSLENATEALNKDLISETEYDAIFYAHQMNQTPPQNTALGGQIGLHGLGKGDEKIHSLMNWTHGCVALTNNQLDELDQWIVEGMRVKIK